MQNTIDFHKYNVCIAVDTSKKTYAVTHMNQQKQYKHTTMSADPNNLIRFAKKRFPDQHPLFVYEAGPGGYNLYDELTHHGFHCMIVHPASLAKASNDRVKTNRLDSKKLAEQTLAGQLKSIRIPSMDYRQLRHLATTRQQYAQDIRKTKQRIKGLILFENIPIPEEVDALKHWSCRYRQSLRSLVCSNQTVSFRLHMLLDDLEHAQQRLLIVHKQLRQFYLVHPELRKNIQLLRTIPGCGFVVSMYVLSRIGDPARLKNVRELGAFAGLVSSEYSTGEIPNRGEITRMGDRILRTLLIEAAWVAIRKDSELSKFYYRIKARHTPKAAANKAIVAVARKLTMRIYRVLKDQRPYEIR